MKKSNNRTLILSVIICLLPVILGIALYDKLPESMPIHFTFNNKVDNYGPKNLALFGLPVLMAALQLICCLGLIKYNNDKKLPAAAQICKWIIPVATVVCYIMMIRAGLGNTDYIGKIACLMVGTIFLSLGNYLPKMSYDMAKHTTHPAPKDEKSFRKTSRITGYVFVLVGIGFLILMFFV